MTVREAKRPLGEGNDCSPFLKGTDGVDLHLLQRVVPVCLVPLHQIHQSSQRCMLFDRLAEAGLRSRRLTLHAFASRGTCD